MGERAAELELRVSLLPGAQLNDAVPELTVGDGHASNRTKRYWARQGRRRGRAGRFASAPHRTIPLWRLGRRERFTAKPSWGNGGPAVFDRYCKLSDPPWA